MYVHGYVDDATLFIAVDGLPHGKKMRRLDFTDHKKVSGRLMPTKMRMTPLDTPGEYTEIHYKEIDFGAKINKGFFSIQKLKSL